MIIDRNIKVGQLATEHPLATRVLARHRIDFCCGGGKPLREVCSKLDLDVDAVLEEIEKELADADAPEVRWDDRPLTDLIDHILAAYHRPLKDELPRLESMARKVLEAHQEKEPEMLSTLLDVFVALRTELEQHMAKEEQILFPMIQSGQGAMCGGPISVMEQEHESAGAALRRLRELTGDYQVPEKACTTWRALWHGLETLEHSLHQHIHLESNILFPRAVAGMLDDDTQC